MLRKPFIFLITILSINCYADSNPCGGTNSLLALIDRPTASDSACVVPYHEVVLETGFQYVKLFGKGYLQDYPQAEIRFGLPYMNELAIVVSNYVHENVSPHSGMTATTVGIKHELKATKNWVTAIESLITLPVGSRAFGSGGVGIAINGILSYDISKKINLTTMIGVTSYTTPKASGSKRYNSFNPDVVFTYAITHNFDYYLEVYGATKTGPGQGSGFNADTGFLYLINPKMVFDIEVGKRLSGLLSGFNYFYGLGFSFVF